MLKFLVILGTCILRYLDIFGSILRFVAICLGMTQVLSIFGVQHVEFGILGVGLNPEAGSQRMSQQQIGVPPPQAG